MSTESRESDVEIIEVDEEKLTQACDQAQSVTEHLQTSTAVLHEILNGGDRATRDFGHMCQQCGKVYKSVNTLHTHKQLKHPASEMEAQCSVCNKKYSSRMSLQKHVQYKHRYDHKCLVCYRSFMSIEMLGGLHLLLDANLTFICQISTQ